MKTFLTSTLLFIIVTVGKTAVWDGGGDGTSYNDPLNWVANVVPAAGAVDTFPISVTLTGTVTNNPSRLVISANQTLTLDLNMTIDNVVASNHAIKLQANSILNIASGRTITIENLISTRDGFQIDASSGAVVNISSGAIVNVTSGRDGVLITAGNTFNNFGTLNLTSNNSDGIDNSGTFNNKSSGILNITDANVIGINQKLTAAFTNENVINITNPGVTTDDGILMSANLLNSGTITVVKMNDDGIEVVDGSTLTNNGTINTTTDDVAIAGNVGIVVGNSNSATLINNNIINADGGSGTTTNNIAIQVLSGTLTNEGTITTTNGNDSRIITVDGTLNNNKGGIIDLTSRRMRVTTGTLTNNSLMKSTYVGTGVFISSTGSAINNGFYNFGGAWASGSTGTNVDNGINLNDPLDININLAGGCMVDLAQVPCDWYQGSSFIATASNTGLLSLPANSLTSDPAVITIQDVPGINITISNICAASVLPITLSYFDAKKRENAVELFWQTATEINNDFFTIERSNDGYHFEPIAEIKGAGNSFEIIDYTFLDENTLTGMNYYRLKQTDYDGNFSTSEVRSVKLDHGKTLTIRGELNAVLVNSDEEYSIEIYDLYGRSILSKRGLINLSKIETYELSLGVYTLIATDSNSQVSSYKFLKM